MKTKIIELRLKGLSYNDIQKELNCSKSTISYHCSKMELNKPVNNEKRVSRIGNIRKGERFCIVCSKDISDKPYRQILCSTSCSAIHKNNNEYNSYIENWKKGLETGGKGDDNGHGVVSNHVRKYIFEKYDCKCAVCKWGEKNIYTNTIPLEIEHIDGNPMNHKEENLTLLCPNCHSLTKGHSTSKGNGRRYYREKYKKEICSTQ